MKIFLIILGVALSAGAAEAQQNSEDVKAIEKVCNSYLIGGTNRDSALFASAFSPAGNMMFMRGDTLKIVPLADFMRSVKPGEKLKRTTRIEDIKIYGDAAVALLYIETDTVILHDIMQLLKTKEGWKIVNKIFNRENK